MKKPNNRGYAGLKRLIADPDTAVQVVSYTDGTGEDANEFGPMRTGVDYWPRQHQGSDYIEFVNTTGVISYGWPGSWTYRSEDDGQSVIAIRQHRPDGARLVIRLHQPEVLAANWSASIQPDRNEE